jgi:hypothetical protein
MSPQTRRRPSRCILSGLASGTPLPGSGSMTARPQHGDSSVTENKKTTAITI